MTGSSSSAVAPTGEGGAPIMDPDLIGGVSILGASRFAVTSRLCSPGSSAKSAQAFLTSLSSIRTTMIVSPGPVLQALRTMPTYSFGRDWPSYIWTGLALRLQWLRRIPIKIRPP